MRIGITGHRLLGDRKNEDAIRVKLEEVLVAHAHASDEALSSLAIGADQIFAEVALALAMRLYVVLPCARYETTFQPAELQSFDRLLALATRTTQLVFAAPSEAAFEAAGRFIVDNCDLMIAVWDGEEARGRGGTADIVAYAQARGAPLIVLPAH